MTMAMDTRSEWEHKQKLGEAEYGEETSELIRSIFGHLKGFVSRYAARQNSGGEEAAMLDVGCGISPAMPAYIDAESLRHNGFRYVGLDPMKPEVQREYEFIPARFEDCPETREYGLFLFCTSLDHFENMEDIAAKLQKLKTDNAVALFAVGLHDADLVARMEGAEQYARLTKSFDQVTMIVSYLKMIVGFPFQMRALNRRVWKLKHAVPLDQFHFHYFTKSSLKQALEHFGAIEEMLYVPNTNVVFAAVRL